MDWYPPEHTRKRLPLLYPAAIGLTALVVWLYPPVRPLFLDIPQWWVLALSVATGHALCGLAGLVISGSPSKGLWHFAGSFLAYGRRASAAHAQTALLVALAEETLFRGLGLAALTQLTGSLVAGDLLAASLFVLIHVRRGGNPLRYLDLFLFSLVVSAGVYNTGSIYPALIMHAVRNYALRAVLVARAASPPARGT